MNVDALNVAKRAFFLHKGNMHSSLEAAVKAYEAELCKPGELIVGEAIQPQRDYRKELWVQTALEASGAATEAAAYASKVVLAFDAFFKENP